ncbi:oligoribonuclease, partial [Candidatus Saccharibacteria bacterium 32-49-10]
MTKLAKVLWVDLEMTGLDPREDVILEVAAIATDWDFNTIATYEGVIKQDKEVIERRMKVSKAFWDANPTARDSLIAQNERGKVSELIEDSLMRFIDEHFEADTKVIMAGNSIHQDRQFMNFWWPRLASKLHYRMLDVSAWKVVFSGKYGKQ